MMMRRCMYVLLLLLQYYNLAAAAVTSDDTTVVTTTTKHLSRDYTQKLALYHFKLSFSINTSSQSCDAYLDDSSSWHPKTMNWSMNSDYCKWEGVTCNQTTGDVIGLDLYCSHLIGSISPNSTLFQLSHLQVIDFNENDISGVIPDEIFHLPNLKELRVSPSIGQDRKTSDVWFNTEVSVSLPKLKWGSNHTLQLLSLEFITIIGGIITEEIFHLPNLKELYIFPHSNNNVSVILPKLKWGSSNTLQSLYLFGITMTRGVIPDSIGYLNSLTSLDLFDCNLTGPIPKSMGNLTQLTSLDLSGNQLSGRIPDFLANLKKLEALILSANQLSGRIPDYLANLKKLELLALHKNNLNGEFPSWVANLTQLQSLDLSHNSLTGSLPSYLPPHSLLNFLQLNNNPISGTIPSWLFQLPSLTHLYIHSNKFTGQLPYQFNSSGSSLKNFDCRNNLLNGTIPKSFSDQLVNLTEIDLSSNKFSGDLDLQSFSHLHYLQSLYLSDNSLSLRITSTTTLPPSLERLGLSSCKITKFPHFIRSLKNLTHLELSNIQIDGNIPNWIASLENLEYLDLSNNQIDGNIPNWIGGLTGMHYLNLSHNSLTGGVEQLTWSSLQYLDLQSNMLNGSLSSSICNSTSLEILNLSHNNFSGVFPVCHGNLSYRLSVLDLRMNNITGTLLPLALSKFQNLRSLNMHGNKLQGTIPLPFSEFDFLEVLDLGSNHINDMFPHFLEALPKLQVLILKSNKFHGIINNISRTEHPFPSLRIVDLSDNQFSGPLPAKYIENFNGMMNKEVNKVPLGYMGDDLYSDSIALVIKGVEFEFVKILTVLTTIDLSRNMFEGGIPAHIGKLVSLRYLNLSHNHLIGNIPSSIGDLLVLGSLDLSSNQLVGEIPQQLTHINDLSDLNLSQNKLSGHIPEGAQFNTFENDSYAGNPGLCGRPLSRKCGRDINEPNEEDEEDDDYFFSGFSWEAVVIGYGSGVVLGFVGGYIMFMAGKPRWYVGIIAIELGLKVRRMEIIRR